MVPVDIGFNLSFSTGFSLGLYCPHALLKPFQRFAKVLANSLFCELEKPLKRLRISTVTPG